MKKMIAIMLCLLLTLSVIGCGKKTDKIANTTTSTVSEHEIQSEIKDPTGERPEFYIDTASLDIDNDGIYEECSMTSGPTSGLFTVVITASVDGTIKYKNTFNIIGVDVSFAEKGGIAQFVRGGEYHRLYVEDNRIVIENLDPQYEGYWGDSEWNYDLK